MRTKVNDESYPVCNDTKVCFARREDGKCEILVTGYECDGDCKFCKPDREVTNGKKYPIGVGVGIGGHAYAI